MHLLLTSNGIEKKIQQSFLSLLSTISAPHKAAFITTAALDKGEDNPNWLNYYRKQLRSFGISDIEDIDLRNVSQNILHNKLEEKNVIFVNGGNTYYLMKYVRESGFDAVLSQILSKEKIYVGVSAGSVIMGPDISLASWIPNDEDVNDNYVSTTSGLEVVPFAIWPHFQTQHTEILEEKSIRIPYSLIALTNEQAILVDNTTYTIVGTPEKHLYNNPPIGQ